VGVVAKGDGSELSTNEEARIEEVAR